MPSNPPRVPPRTSLRAARERMGISQPDLARRLGVKRLTVLDIEKGRKHPSFALMQRWTQELGVSLDLFDSGAPTDHDKEPRQAAE